jgi:hypothetical protein
MLDSIVQRARKVKRKIKEETKMTQYLENMLRAMRPAFSRKAVFVWFVVAVAGIATRSDVLGVTSIVRALWLAPACYPCLLHFFHSEAWTAGSLMRHWWKWLDAEGVARMHGERIVLLGDHTKHAKDGRKMPQVATLHQDSETSSKPSYFRGHHWGALCLLTRRGSKHFGTPLWAEIHRDDAASSRAVRPVEAAIEIAQDLGKSALLVLDAFFSAGPVFLAAARSGVVDILTRAKKSVVAYRPPEPATRRGPGRPRIYGAKLKLMQLFKTMAARFEESEAFVYGRRETVRHLTLDLLWKPVAAPLRFFLLVTSRGPIILMTSDFSMDAVRALELYCCRVSIETLFDGLKNLLGALGYHFWSRYLEKVSRRPAKNAKPQTSSRPEKTRNTLDAIERFVAVGMFVMGMLQMLAFRFSTEIRAQAHCWLRTPCGEIPSPFVTKTALARLIRANLLGFGKDLISHFIRQKRNNGEISKDFTEVA